MVKQRRSQLRCKIRRDGRPKLSTRFKMSDLNANLTLTPIWLWKPE